MPFFRRIGGALRGLLRRGTAPAGQPRRPATPQPSRTPPATRDKPPRPPRARAPRQPRAAAPAPSPRPGWFARWFGRRRPASPTPAPLPDSGDGLFTPEAYAALPAEVRELLRTPVGDCDPVLLYGVFAVFAEQIARHLPPELGMDAEALFAELWGRVGGMAGPDDPMAEPVMPPAAHDAAPEPSPIQAASSAAEQPVTTAIAPAAAFPARHLPRVRKRTGRYGARRHSHSYKATYRLPARRLWYAACAGPP